MTCPRSIADEKVFNYIEEAQRTKNTDYTGMLQRMMSDTANNFDLLHAAMGISDEAGEFTKAIKDYIFYGKPLDPTNLEEELGDLLWYISIAMAVLGTNFGRVQKMNIEKLRKRFPDKFTKNAAINRNLEEERKTLEEV